MLAASVRLRVEDPLGHSCGSGTIIDARAGGEALVLTCGHLFRDSQGTGKIDVDVFGPTPAARVPGRLVAFDLERDVALIAFQPPGPVMVARVAPPGYSIRRGDAVAPPPAARPMRPGTCKWPVSRLSAAAAEDCSRPRAW
jgi:hypothetical protein